MNGATFPAGPHRMANPLTRVRTLIAGAALLGALWAGITLANEQRCGAFSQRELRELAGLPVPPACVQRQLPPSNPIEQLQNNFPGATP